MNVIIIDDDPIVTLSLKTIIESQNITVTALAHDGKDALPLYQKYACDVLMLDIQMKEVSGISAAKEVLAYDNDAKILFLTTFLDDDYIIEALHLGAKGYLTKSKVAKLISALEAINQGHRVFDDEIVEKLPHLMVTRKKENPFKVLKEVEWEIVQLIAQGLNNQEIAERLHFSLGTIRNYVSLILEKLQVRDRLQLTILYYKNSD